MSQEFRSHEPRAGAAAEPGHSKLRTLTRAGQVLRAVSAQSSSSFANQIVAFVVPWLVLARTGSALNAGTVAFTTGVAAVLVGRR